MKYSTLNSFDIFDTLITRIVANPEGIFLMIKEKLKSVKNDFKLPEELINNFFMYRIEAQKISALNPNKKEYTLEDIYYFLSKKFYLTKEQENYLINLEIETEMECCLPIEENIGKVKQIGEKEVFFLSDMYLSKEVILKLLNKVGIYPDPKKVYVSSEIGMNKSSGELFDYFAKSNNIKYSELTHIGDNFISDYIIPRKKGIKANYFNKTKLNYLEENILKGENNLTKQIIVGIIRYLRLSHEDQFYLLGLNFGAIPFFFYTLWCLNLARDLNLDRLFFVSRDGEALLEIANLIKNYNNAFEKLECKYFYTSRYASYLSNLSDLSNPNNLTFESIKNFFPSFEETNLYSILKKLKIDTLQNEAVSLFNEKIKINKNLSDSKKFYIISKIFSDDKFKNLITANLIAQKQLSMDYYKQEGLFDKNKKIGFVDVGWQGTTIDSIGKSINSNSKLIGMYFGILSKNYDLYKQNNIFGYYYNSSHSNFLKKYINGNIGNILEFLLSANHGSVIGYHKVNENILPLFNEENNECLNRERIINMRQAYFDFINFLMPFIESKYIDQNKIEEILDNLFYTLKVPNKEVVALLENICIMTQIMDTHKYQFVKAINIRDLIKIIFRKKVDFVWLEGSIYKSRLYIKIIYKTYIISKKSVKFILRKLVKNRFYSRYSFIRKL